MRTGGCTGRRGFEWNLESGIWNLESGVAEEDGTACRSTCIDRCIRLVHNIIKSTTGADTGLKFNLSTSAFQAVPTSESHHQSDDTQTLRERFVTGRRDGKININQEERKHSVNTALPSLWQLSRKLR